MSDIKLQCSVCLKKYGTAKYTEYLKLRTIRGKDYLVCKYHENSYGGREVHAIERPVFK